jgi:predicted Zn finger-like uncharacterized protein
MQSPQAQTVVITCPNCGTRYQVTPDTLGAAGRKVSCAECGKAWLATATPPEPPPPPLAAEDEDQLDAAFAVEQAALIESAADREMEAEAAAEEPPETPGRPVVSPAVRAQKKAQGRFLRRQRRVESGMPVARIRTYARLSAIAGLVGVVAGLGLFRVEVVRMVPDLAGLYAAVGLGVNIVGLEFADVSTLLSRRDGVDVLGVSGTIYPVAQRTVAVPPVIVTIRDGSEHVLYEWSVTPELRSLGPGEIARFSTELASPPTGAQSVHLSFATGNGGTASIGASHGAAAEHGAPEHGEPEHGTAAAEAAGAEHGEPAASSAEHAAAPAHDDTSHEVSNDASHSSEGLAGH